MNHFHFRSRPDMGCMYVYRGRDVSKFLSPTSTLHPYPAVTRHTLTSLHICHLTLDFVQDSPLEDIWWHIVLSGFEGFFVFLLEGLFLLEPVIVIYVAERKVRKLRMLTNQDLSYSGLALTQTSQTSPNPWRSPSLKRSSINGFSSSLGITLFIHKHKRLDKMTSKDLSSSKL